jgi:hypothetical protein
MSETYFRFFDLPEEIRDMIIKKMSVLSRINFIIAINGSLNIKASEEDWENADSDVETVYSENSEENSDEN